MTTMVTGKSAAEAEKMIAEFVGMLTAEDDPALTLESHGDLAALAGVRKFPARVKCAALAWHALGAAIRGEGETSTE